MNARLILFGREGRAIGGYFEDLDNGDIGYAFDDFGVNSKGEELMYVGGGMIENLATGEVHHVDQWPGTDSSDPWAEDEDIYDDTDDDDSAESSFSYSYSSYSPVKRTAPGGTAKSVTDLPEPKSYDSFDSVEPHHVYMVQKGKKADAEPEKKEQEQPEIEASVENEKNDSVPIWPLIVIFVVPLLILLGSAISKQIAYNEGVEYYNQGVEYYNHGYYESAQNAFWKAAGKGVPGAAQWKWMSSARYNLIHGKYVSAQEDLEILLRMDISSEMRREAETRLQYVNAQLAKESAQSWDTGSSSSSSSTSSGRKTSPGKKRSSPSSDPYGASDYAHPDDFYYDYYDDFWDYEDAEDYWEEYG